MNAWRARSETLLMRALEWTSRPRTVGLFEYQLDPAVRYGWGQPPHQGLKAILAAGEARYERAVETVLAYEPEFKKIPKARRPGGELSWDNDYWGGLDAAALYAVIGDRQPDTYLEVGSGYSTMFARRAIDDHQLRTRIVSIDPAPRAEIDAMCDEVIRSPLERADLGIASSLRSGDVVVIDGTHTAFMNSDAVAAFFDLLPALAPGVLVCIDDIFLPWDYPPAWTNRWYGEQYMLGCLLLGGHAGWNLVFPAWYMTQESPFKDRLDPIWDHVAPAAGKYAKSFWMERC